MFTIILQTTSSFYIQLYKLNTAGLELLFKWAVRSASIPPLGLPKRITIQFLYGCDKDCRCRPTTSTCDLVITIPVHVDNENDMKEIMASAIVDCDGFGLIKIIHFHHHKWCIYIISDQWIS